MIRADYTVSAVGGGLTAEEMSRLAALGSGHQAAATARSVVVAPAATSWRIAFSPPAHDVLGPALVLALASELGRVAAARVLPSGFGCPGGSLSACMGLCPSTPLAAFQACVDDCARRCT